MERTPYSRIVLAQCNAYDKACKIRRPDVRRGAQQVIASAGVNVVDTQRERMRDGAAFTGSDADECFRISVNVLLADARAQEISKEVSKWFAKHGFDGVF